MKKNLIPISILLFIGSFICGCGNDIGEPCYIQNLPSCGRAKIIEDVTIPCDGNICIAVNYINDKPEGYCSKKCSKDSNCPSGYACRALNKSGTFEDVKVCVDKHDLEEFQSEGWKAQSECEKKKTQNFINNSSNNSTEQNASNTNNNTNSSNTE